MTQSDGKSCSARSWLRRRQPAAVKTLAVTLASVMPVDSGFLSQLGDPPGARAQPDGVELTALAVTLIFEQRPRRRCPPPGLDDGALDDGCTR